MDPAVAEAVQWIPPWRRSSSTAPSALSLSCEGERRKDWGGS
uniref:Uncharacterized protein n=1 Tax=Arundo donax TaxID=35708 RepID=A0A0A8ZHB0_ARUDO